MFSGCLFNSVDHVFTKRTRLQGQVCCELVSWPKSKQTSNKLLLKLQLDPCTRGRTYGYFCVEVTVAHAEILSHTHWTDGIGADFFLVVHRLVFSPLQVKEPLQIQRTESSHALNPRPLYGVFHHGLNAFPKCPYTSWASQIHPCGSSRCHGVLETCSVRRAVDCDPLHSDSCIKDSNEEIQDQTKHHTDCKSILNTRSVLKR